MQKVLFSLLLMGMVAAMAGVGTLAYFSDVETSTRNVFQAGTIDIAVDGQNPWVTNFTLEGFKPCETAYIEFVIENVGTNPVNVSKHLIVTGTAGGLHPESEEAEDPDDTRNDIHNYTWFDLSVAIYNETGVLLASEMIYSTGEITIKDINCTKIWLGILCPGWYMIVNQSAHIKPDVTNWAQGDVIYIDEEIIAEQVNLPVQCP